MAPRKVYTQPQAGAQGFARTRKVVGNIAANILTTDLVTANAIAIFMAPKDFVVTGINAVIPSLDSGAALTISIGDAANAARLVSASTVGRSPGGSITTLAAGAAGYQFPADTEVWMTFPAGSATPVAGSASVLLEGYLGP
jgi:hypothetical protein